MQVYVNLFDLLSPLGCKPEEGARNGMFPANPPEEQRGLLARHAALPAACLPALLPRGWGKNASCCISAPLMELQTPGFVSGCRHLDAFCDAVLAQVPSCNRLRGCVSFAPRVSQDVSSQPLPICVPGSLPLPAHLCAVSITAASGNFSRRLPASDSRAQGTLPLSGSRGPPVLFLTPSSPLRQPPPPLLPLLQHRAAPAPSSPPQQRRQELAPPAPALQRAGCLS